MKMVVKAVSVTAAAVAVLGAGLIFGMRVARAQPAEGRAAIPLDISPAVPLSVRVMDAAPTHYGARSPFSLRRGAPDADLVNYNDEIHLEMASGLKMSVEDFEAALMSGRSPWAIAQDKGLTGDQFHVILVKAYTNALAQAVNEGKLTEAQADQILADFTERIQNGALPGYGPYSMHHLPLEMAPESAGSNS